MLYCCICNIAFPIKTTPKFTRRSLIKTTQGRFYVLHNCPVPMIRIQRCNIYLQQKGCVSVKAIPNNLLFFRWLIAVCRVFAVFMVLSQKAFSRGIYISSFWVVVNHSRKSRCFCQFMEYNRAACEEVMDARSSLQSCRIPHSLLFLSSSHVVLFSICSVLTLSTTTPK